MKVSSGKRRRRRRQRKAHKICMTDLISPYGKAVGETLPTWRTPQIRHLEFESFGVHFIWKRVLATLNECRDITAAGCCSSCARRSEFRVLEGTMKVLALYQSHYMGNEILHILQSKYWDYLCVSSLANNLLCAR